MRGLRDREKVSEGLKINPSDIFFLASDPFDFFDLPCSSYRPRAVAIFVMVSSAHELLFLHTPVARFIHC